MCLLQRTSKNSLLNTLTKGQFRNSIDLSVHLMSVKLLYKHVLQLGGQGVLSPLDVLDI